MFCDTLKISPVREFSDKDAIIHDDGRGSSEKLTYEQLWQEIANVSRVVREAGLGKGDRVLFVSENHLHWLPIFLGIAGAGAIAVPVDGNIAVARFKAIIEDCHPALVIVSRLFEHRLGEFNMTENEICDTLHLHFDVFSLGKGLCPQSSEPELKPHDIAAIIYTSGTTGQPKGIMLSHKAFVASVELGLKISDYHRDDRMLTLLPFTHVFSLVDAGLVMLGCHSTLVVCNSFNPGEIIPVIMKHRITYVMAVPRLADLFAFGLMQKPDLKLPGITMIIGGAAPKSQVMQLLNSRGIRTFQGFGMTETAAGVLIGRDCPLEAVGKPQEGVKVKIGNPVDGVGELLILTPTIFSGVFGKPELDQEMFLGEYFKTGDIAQIGNNGFVYIRGRAKEVIISASGLNVYPDELELRLATLPYAEEFVIFGYCEGELEIPAIALLGRNEFFKDYSVGKEQEYVEEDIRKKVAEWPEAERIRKVFIVDKPLPRSASAKIKRFEVAAMFSPEAAKRNQQSERAVTAAKSTDDREVVDAFIREVAAFLNVEPDKFKLTTRLDSFMQLDSLGVVAMLIKLEQRFSVSFRELIGTSVETFEELFNFFSNQVSPEKIEEASNGGPAIAGLPPLLDFSPTALEQRQQYVRKSADYNDFKLPVPEDPAVFTGNIEGFAGFVQVPVGLCGPLKVRGKHADGDFLVPMATTEGALVSSVSRGCQVISMSGGAQVRIVAEGVIRTPVFVLKDLEQLEKFTDWVADNFSKIARSAESTTSHGKLKAIEPFPIGSMVVLRFNFSTGDASGQNMTTIATRCSVDYILENYPGVIQEWFLESNLSGDKKINAVNFTRSRGKKLVAQCLIPAQVVKSILHTTPQQMCRLADLAMVTSMQAHSFGMQAHYANTLAAVYIAAGQDPACVAESAAGITFLQLVGEDLQISVTLPGIMVGTVGGGTRLPTQNSCLQMMGCAGAGKAAKFAEILAAAVLAGEISIIGAMAADEFTQAHARYGRAGGLNDKKA
ncbi:MAG: AMP-binding protein [Candidatus Riflebacteria bacterium]|nr:AMP-binding protein [Candidatus Riflebacteria bacterium]